MITAREAWITGTILGKLRGGIPGTDLIVRPPDNHADLPTLEVYNPEGRIVARIMIIDMEFTDTV